MDEIVIPDPQKGMETHLILDKDGLVTKVEIYYEQPRPISAFFNWAVVSAPAPPGGPRPCGGSGRAQGG